MTGERKKAREDAREDARAAVPVVTSWGLAAAFCWRLRREGARYLLAPCAVLALVLVAQFALAEVAGGRALDGASGLAAVAARYTLAGESPSLGLVLTFGPGAVALWSAATVTRAVRGLIGAEVGRGGFEELLSAPCPARRIARGLLGCAVAVATCCWCVFTALAAVAVAAVARAEAVPLDLSVGYLSCALALPLLVAWLSGGLALVVNLLLPLPRTTRPPRAIRPPRTVRPPRRTERNGRNRLIGLVGLPGTTVANLVSTLPGPGTVLALAYGLPGLGAVPLLITSAAVAAVLIAASMTAVSIGFRPEVALAP